MKDRRAGALLAGALLVALGCAGTPQGAAPASAGAASSSSPLGSSTGSPASTDQQVMVTYAAAPPAIWAQNSAEIAQQYRLSIVLSWTLASLGQQCVIFEVPHGRTTREVIRRLSSDPRVSLAQAIETFRTQGGGDPYAHLQHASQTLRLDLAHRMATGKGVRVAVVDTGVDFDHPDLRGRVTKARSFVDRGEKSFTTDIHGTAVAGVIAATANNDIGIVGVAPEAEVFAIKACWQQPPGAREAVCNSYTLAQAVDFAINQGAQVLNFSLAGPSDPLLGRLIGQALARGIVVVAADGGTPAQDFPASYKGVIGIMGSDDVTGSGAPTLPAGHPFLATLAAPGVDILTTVPHASYDFFSGSSLAAAQVSGVAALMLEKNPKLTPAQLAAVIHKTARPLSPATVGEVDACAAVASVAGGGCP